MSWNQLVNAVTKSSVDLLAHRQGVLATWEPYALITAAAPSGAWKPADINDVDGWRYANAETVSRTSRRPMGSLVGRENWRSLAACRSADPDLFFPISSSDASLAQVAEAKAICAGCQVRRDCLAFALRTHQVHGVWGGLSEQERYPLWSATLAESNAAKPARSTQFTLRSLETMRINEPPPPAR